MIPQRLSRPRAESVVGGVVGSVEAPGLAIFIVRRAPNCAVVGGETAGNHKGSVRHELRCGGWVPGISSGGDRVVLVVLLGRNRAPGHPGGIRADAWRPEGRPGHTE